MKEFQLYRALLVQLPLQGSCTKATYQQIVLADFTGLQALLPYRRGASSSDSVHSRF